MQFYAVERETGIAVMAVVTIAFDCGLVRQSEKK
jgi:hypothetical protein